MDGVNEPDENGKISNFLDPDAEKQTFGRKLQNWPNLRDENGIFTRPFIRKQLDNAYLPIPVIEEVTELNRQYSLTKLLVVLLFD
ncbi:hypothetical protein Hanom_Chr12g01165101 [Helianthus anomalus]